MTLSRPLFRASVLGTYTTFLSPDGTAHHLEATEGADIRAVVLAHAVGIAAQEGQEVELHTTGDTGEHHFLVLPDGTVTTVVETIEDSPASLSTDHDGLARAAEALRQAPPTMDEPDQPRRRARSATNAINLPETPMQPAGTATVNPAELEEEIAELDEDVPPQRNRRASFIVQNEIPDAPSTGWRRMFGIKASPEEQALADARRTVSSHWPTVRRIAVVNGKGGAGKTTTTACVAAVYARFGGGGVLAWDNNPTRGTLGWRTEAAKHTATVQDVLDDADRLLEPRTPLSAIAGYVHHQTEDRYDVLRSNPEMLAIRQQIAAVEFDKLIDVMDRNFRLVVFDSGNDESADRWLRMIDHAHQLIVPTSAAPEAAETAQLLLEALAERDEHSAFLARNAVVVVSDGERAAQTTATAQKFRDAGYRAEVISFDPALKSGALRFSNLRQVTQNDWVRVAAAAAETF